MPCWAPHGEIFGALRDVDAYALLMRREVAPFLRLADRLAAGTAPPVVLVVAGDACEGYNPMHDICRALVDVVCTLIGVEDAAHNLAIRSRAGRRGPPARWRCASTTRASPARWRAARGYRELRRRGRRGRSTLRGGGLPPREVLEPTLPWTPRPSPISPITKRTGGARGPRCVHVDLRYRITSCRLSGPGPSRGKVTACGGFVS